MKHQSSETSGAQLHLSIFVADCVKELEREHHIQPAPKSPQLKNAPTMKPLKVGEVILSPRETQCAKLLVEKRYYHKVAQTLGLSKRTVEFYFENIKQKLKIYKKKHLIEFFANEDFFVEC